MVKNNQEQEQFVDRRINDLDRRRDIRLNDKISALERYFELSLSTRAEALRIAIDRMQSENKDCSSRCANQIKIFYELINGIKERQNKRAAVMDALKRDAIKLSNDYGALTAMLAVNKTATETQLAALTGRVDAIDRWKQTAFSKAVIASIVAAIGVIHFGFLGFNWIVDFISKILQSTPK